MNDFAHIRILRNRQVLFYTECTDDGYILFVIFRLKNGTSVDMKLHYSSESELEQGLADAKAGTHDKIVGDHIGLLDKKIQVVKDKS